MSNKWYYICSIVLLLACASCSIQKKLPKGTHLYGGATVVVKKQRIIKANLNPLEKP